MKFFRVLYFIFVVQSVVGFSKTKVWLIYGENVKNLKDKSKFNKPEEAVQNLILSGKHSDDIVKRLSNYQLIYSILGLIVGLICIFGGVFLFYSGITGSMNWTAKILGASSNLVNSAPGAVLFIVGLFIVFISRFMIKSRR